jgi:Flp pilus assembly protein TadB
MDEQDPNQSQLDPRAVPVAVASVALIVIGIVSTYANLTIGALIALLGVCGIVWVAVLATKSPGE